MSLILEALKKADENRTSREITNHPLDDTNHYDDSLTAENRNSRTKILFTAGLAFLILLAWIVFSQYDNENTPRSTSNNNSDQLAAADSLVPQEEKKTTDKEASPAKIITAKSINSTNDQQFEQLEKKTNIEPKQEDEEIATLYQEVIKETPSTDIREIEKDNINHISINDQAKDTQTQDVPEPEIDQLSLDFYQQTKTINQMPIAAQNKIPTLMYNAHSFQENGRSSVVINGKTVREGQNIENDIKVKKILRDGLILQNSISSFKLRAMSSWINY